MTAAAVLEAVLGGTFRTGVGPIALIQHTRHIGGAVFVRAAGRGVGCRIDVSRCPDLVCVLVTAGYVHLRRAGRTVELGPGGCGLLGLREPSQIRWDEARFDLFRIPAAAVLDLLRSPDEGVLRSSRTVPPDAELASLWRRLAEVLQQQPDSVDGDPAEGRFCSATARALVAASVEAFDISDGTEGLVESPAAVVSRVKTYLSAHLGHPLTLQDIARGAGTSVPAIHAAYEALEAGGALEHLRRLRMASAHRALSAAPRGTGVLGIARAHGYANLGRFGAHYRVVFGESPSETMRRGQR